MLKSLVYLFGGFLFNDIKTILYKLSEVKQIMASNLDQILENQRALTSALNELADAQQKTLDELKKEIENLENQGAEVDKLNEILNAQQAAIDTIKRLKDAAVEAEPKLVAFINERKSLADFDSDLVPTSNVAKDESNAPPANMPAQNPPPMHHPVSVSTESVESAKGNVTHVKNDGSIEVKNPDGEVIHQEDLPENMR